LEVRYSSDFRVRKLNADGVFFFVEEKLRIDEYNYENKNGRIQVNAFFVGKSRNTK